MQGSDGLASVVRRLQDNDLLLTRLADGTGVLLDLSGHQVLTLNPTGVVLVEKISEGVVVADDLAVSLAVAFSVDDLARCESEVRAFLVTLERACG